MNVQGNGHEHEFEAAYGLPEPLPKGESILWQGAPDFSDMLVRVFHFQKAIIYFVVLMVVRGSFLYTSGSSTVDIAVGVLMVAGLGLVALSALAMLAWLTARTTAYTLTDQRVVMRIGIVLTLTFNLPFKRIKTAGLQLTPQGFGDIPLALSGGNRIGYLNLWPHARAWRIANPEPMMRCLPDAQAVGAMLQNAWANATGKPATPGVQPTPDAQSASWHVTHSLANKPF